MPDSYQHYYKLHYARGRERARDRHVARGRRRRGAARARVRDVVMHVVMRDRDRANPATVAHGDRLIHVHPSTYTSDTLVQCTYSSRSSLKGQHGN